MKIQNIRAVKASLNRVVAKLPETGTVVITRSGKPCAALVSVKDEAELEALLSHQVEALVAEADFAECLRGDCTRARSGPAHHRWRCQEFAGDGDSPGLFIRAVGDN